MYTRKIMRIYLLVQTVCLCLTLLAAGTCIAAQRTEYAASGVAVSIQTDRAVETALTRLSDRSLLQNLRQWIEYMPYPIGNVAAIISSIKNIIAGRDLSNSSN